MIIGANRKAVIENIKACAESGDLNHKVETGDPNLSAEQEKAITDAYINGLKTPSYKIKRAIARAITNIAGARINADTEIVGSIDKKAIEGGFIVTSNHFSPLENTAVRYVLRKNGVKKMSILSQVSNFAMDGFVAFLMNYADTVPLSHSPHYFARELSPLIEQKIRDGEALLIYPEGEMWFNYRKPRPQNEGAYHFASRFGCPVVSLFMEIIDLDKPDGECFNKVKYRAHVLGTLYPDMSLPEKERKIKLMNGDHELKKQAYEQIYGKKLVYSFEKGDIAGWKDE